MSNPLSDVTIFVDDTNALSVAEAKRDVLIAVLKPIADKIDELVTYSNTVTVTDEASAKKAAAVRDHMIEGANIAESAIRDFDENLLERLFKAHRKGTALIGRFSVLNDAARKVKQAILSWQQREAEKAEKQRALLQAKLDEQARAERERLEKEAAKLKTPALKEQRLEQAAAIVPSVVQMAAPPKAVKSQTRWKVKAFDMTAMGIPKEVQGYLTVETSRLERAKAANAMLVVSGVEFHTVLC